MNSNGTAEYELRIEKYARSSEHFDDVKKGLERIAEYINKGIELEKIGEFDETTKAELKGSIICMIRYGKEDLLYLKKLNKRTIGNGSPELYSRVNSLILKLEAERENHMSYRERIKNYFKDRITRVIRSGSFDEDYTDWYFRNGYVKVIKLFIDKVKG